MSSTSEYENFICAFPLFLPAKHDLPRDDLVASKTEELLAGLQESLSNIEQELSAVKRKVAAIQQRQTSPPKGKGPYLPDEKSSGVINRGTEEHEL